jgi:transposase
MQGKDMSETAATTPVYAGIDVCKDWLDVYLHPFGRKLRVSNDRSGLIRLARVLQEAAVSGVVMEATGKYHRSAQRVLFMAGLRVAVVNPLRARLFAEATGTLGKTDAIDARLLARMAAVLDPAETPPPSEAMEALGELVNARSAATSEQTALGNRLSSATTAFLRAELRRRIAACHTHIERLDAEIARRLAADPGLARRFAILCSIPGIGAVTAATLITGFEELGSCTDKQACLLAGLAPIANDSGERAGYRSIRGGRLPVRNALYMAALSASRYNQDLAVFADRLRKAGKKPKVVLVAVMRKLVVLANTLITKDRIWTPDPP